MKFTLTKNNLDSLVEKLKQLDFEKLWRVEVHEAKHKRSLEQNNRYWKLLTTIGNHMGYTAEEMDSLMKWQFLKEEVEVNGEKIVKIPSTTTLNTEEMAEYQKQIQWWASQYGFEFKE